MALTYDWYWKLSHVHLRRTCVQLFLDRMFCMCLLDPVGLLCCSGPLFPYLSSGCSICYCEYSIKVPNSCCRTISLFKSVNLSLYNLMIYYNKCLRCSISFCYIETFNTYNVLLFLVTFFDLKFIFSNISLTTPTLLWVLFAWYIFFNPFTFNLFVSCRWCTVGFFFFTSSLLISDFWLESWIHLYFR